MDGSLHNFTFSCPVLNCTYVSNCFVEPEPVGAGLFEYRAGAPNNTLPPLRKSVKQLKIQNKNIKTKSFSFLFNI